MGVLGLWQLLNPTARQVKIEGLEGKTLAIDISIWLYQATKGTNTRNGHIHVLYNRICKLLYYKIKPIFVFDGTDVPVFKRRILQERQRRRQVASNKSKELDLKLQKNLLESYALNQLTGNSDESNDLEMLRLAKLLEAPPGNNEFDIFQLKDEKAITLNDEVDDVAVEQNVLDYLSDYPDLNEIDKDVFDSLPHDIQMELLINYKEKLKRNKFKKDIVEFPEEIEDFSQFQMKALLHKSDVSKRLNDLKKSLTRAQVEVDLPSYDIISQKIASEDDREILFISKKTTKSQSSIIKNYLKIRSLDEGENENEEMDEEKIEIVDENSNSNGVDAIEGSPKIADETRIRVDSINNSIIRLNETDSKIDNKPNNAESATSDVEEIEEKVEKKTADVTIARKSSENDVQDVNEYKTCIEIKSDFEESIEIIEVTPKPDLKPKSPIEQKRQQTETINDESDDDTDSDGFVEVNIEDFVKALNGEPSSVSLNKKLLEPKPTPVLPLTRDTDEIYFLNENKAEPEGEAIDLNEYNEYLKKQKSSILKEKRHEDKLSHSIEDYVVDDAKYLLQIFGLPYIQSPGEAEAQCAHLDLTNQIDGIITDDSDVWLFGASNVYKNFFNQSQSIEHYTNTLIKSQLCLDREALIAIAFLVGSDYTVGIENVGIVKAMEILQEFNGSSGFERLKTFKEWHATAQTSKAQKHNKLKISLSKLNLPDSFPSELIYEAYKKPNVNRSDDEFSWSLPQLDLIRKFLSAKLSWNLKKIDETLLPVIKRLNDTKVQKTIDTYFSTNEMKLASTKQSKRMKDAISSFKRKIDSVEPSGHGHDEDDNHSQAKISVKNKDDVELLDLSDDDEQQQAKKSNDKFVRITKAKTTGTRAKATRQKTKAINSRKKS